MGAMPIIVDSVKVRTRGPSTSCLQYLKQRVLLNWVLQKLLWLRVLRQPAGLPYFRRAQGSKRTTPTEPLVLWGPFLLTLDSSLAPCYSRYTGSTMQVSWYTHSRKGKTHGRQVHLADSVAAVAGAHPRLHFKRPQELWDPPFLLLGYSQSCRQSTATGRAQGSKRTAHIPPPTEPLVLWGSLHLFVSVLYYSLYRQCRF